MASLLMTWMIYTHCENINILESIVLSWEPCMTCEWVTYLKVPSNKMILFAQVVIMFMLMSEIKVVCKNSLKWFEKMLIIDLFCPWHSNFEGQSLHCSIILRDKVCIAQRISRANFPRKFMKPSYFAPHNYGAMHCTLYTVLPQTCTALYKILYCPSTALQGTNNVLP